MVTGKHEDLGVLFIHFIIFVMGNMIFVMYMMCIS